MNFHILSVPRSDGGYQINHSSKCGWLMQLLKGSLISCRQTPLPAISVSQAERCQDSWGVSDGRNYETDAITEKMMKCVTMRGFNSLQFQVLWYASVWPCLPLLLLLGFLCHLALTVGGYFASGCTFSSFPFPPRLFHFSQCFCFAGFLY